jgi:Flp pilus assembly protein TadG
MHSKSQSGQAMVLFAIALLGLLAFVALTADVGKLYVDRRNAQSAADSAAFAAAVAKVKGNNIQTAGATAALTNGFNNNGTTNTVSVYNPPNSGPYATDPNKNDYVQVIITSTMTTSFMHLFGRTNMVETVQAVVKATSNSPISGGDVLVGANKNDCDTIYAHGDITVTLQHGNILSNSDATQAIDGCNSMEKKGTGKKSSGIYTNNGGHTNVVGDFGTTGNPTISPAAVSPYPQKTFPSVPVPDCALASNFAPTPAGSINNGNNFDKIKNDTTLNPGIYGTIAATSKPVITLNPGLYCIHDLSLGAQATLTGNNVMIVFTGGSYDMSGGPSVNLTTHLSTFNLVTTTGTTVDYKGMLILADPSKYTTVGGTTLSMNGNGDATYTGTIYAINNNCALQGTSSVTSFTTQMICNKIDIGGNDTLNMDIIDADIWHGVGSISLMQ